MVRLCSVIGCSNNYLAKSFCNKHYLRNKTYGDPLHVVVRVCSVTGCNNKHKGHGYCVNHLIHYRNYGDPLVYADPEETSRKKSASLKGRTPWNKGKTGVFSEKTRREWSEKRKGRMPHNKGKPHSEETKKKISIAGKGRIVSEATKKKMSERIISAETRKKVSIANKGRKMTAAQNKANSERQKGKKASEATKKKMSASHKGKIKSEATRKKLSLAHKGRKYPDRIVSLETKKKISDANSTPERKAKQRQVMRDMRHNQTSPTVPESIIMKILTGGGIKYKFNKNVDYLTPENTHRKKEIDFLIKPKKIIEFNGYRHFDNRNFKPDAIVTHHNKLKKCQDIWDEEDTVLNQIKKEGYGILIIWDMDLKKDTKNTAKKILKFAKS